MRLAKGICMAGAIGIILIGATNLYEHPGIALTLIGILTAMTFGGCRMAGGWDAIIRE